MNDLARARALATSIKTLATGPALEGLAAELLDVLARVSVAAAGPDAVEPSPPGTAAASTEVIAPPPPSSGGRALSMSADAVRARERRAEQRRLAELAASGQLELPNVRRPRSLGRDDRPTTVASLSTLITDLDQSDQREAGRRRSVVVALDHTTPLDDELLAIAGAEMARRAVVFDIPTAWASFVARYADSALSPNALRAKWKAWCARERASSPAPSDPPPAPRPPPCPADVPAAVDGVELPLEADRPPQGFLDAAEDVRTDLPEFNLRHSFRRFAERHPMHASPAAALAFWLRWVRGENVERVGPRRDTGKSGNNSHAASAESQTRYTAPEQKRGIKSSPDDDDPFALPYPASPTSSTGSLRAPCGREERGRDPPALAASA